MRQSLPQAKLWYSVKTNPLLQLNKDLESLGYNFEITTMADQVVARELKIRPERILYNSFSRLLEEIDFAISDLHCRFLQLDSPTQILLLLDNLKKKPHLAPTLEVSLRIHSGHGHFGFGRFHKMLVESVQQLLQAGVKCSGLHIHRNTAGGFTTAKEQAKNFRENFQILWEQKKFLEKEIPLLYLKNFNLRGGI
jgi:diaminopimelate decarboxylase